MGKSAGSPLDKSREAHPVTPGKEENTCAVIQKSEKV